MRKGESVQNRPDLVARVFKLKKDQLMRDIKSGQILGKVPAFLWVIEFQKRGLPHAHLLIILSNDDRVSCSADVDNIISAELPPDPALFPDGSKQRAQAERLEKIVMQNMIHGPCGKVNPSCSCMVEGKCSKGFPKKFSEKTVLCPDNSYPEYKRRKPSDGGRSTVITSNGRTLTVDNSMVVPYSPFLSLKYNCHINVEIRMSPIASKYLFKYATKGQDTAMVRTEVEDDMLKDEIKEYIDLRSVGSSEASWHLFNFVIAKKYPAVYALKVHLQDEQQVVFDMASAQESMEQQRTTELTAFFDYNKLNPNTKVMYVDFPEFFTWKDKGWKIRKRGPSDTIGRVHNVNPAAGDVYYLRMLLHHEHCKDKVSFEDLRTINGEILESYQEVCRSLGLLQDDREWDEALTHMPSALRELYVTILMFCMPSNPKKLFDDHYLDWTDDFVYEAKKK